MPTAANGAAGTDGELVVIDGDVAYNFWQFDRTSATTATASSFGAENVVTGDGWGTKSPFLSAGITAVGASELGGLLVKAETDDGSIDHALQLVVDSTLAKSGFTGSAIAGDGSSSTGIVQEGEFLAIAPGTAMPAGLSTLGQEVFTAMEKYGAYVVDVAGGTTNIRAQANAYDDATITALWHDMGQITPLLEAVTEPSGSGSPPATSPPVTAPPVTTPVVTAPPVTAPPVTAPPVIAPPVTPPVVTAPPVTAPPAPVTGSTAPTMQWVAANGPGVVNGTGAVHQGGAVQLSVNFSEAVNVTGTPTLTLNDNGVATYVSGSGANTLQFTYKVGAGQNTPDLAITGFNLSGVKDSNGNSVNLAGAPTQPAGTLAISTTTATPTNTTAPTMEWVAANGPGVVNGSGTVHEGGAVRLSVNFSEAVKVTGTPTLALNDNGVATYVSGSGANTLQFTYKVGVDQNTPDLAITGFNLSGVKDQHGNSVNLAGAPTQPAGTLAISSPTSMTSTASPRTTTSASSVTTLAADTTGTTSATPSANVASAAQTSSAGPNMALLNQYAASSFVGSAPGVGAGSSQNAWSSPVHNLAKPMAA